MKPNGGPSEYPKVTSTHRACEVMQWGANVSSNGAPVTRKWQRKRGWWNPDKSFKPKRLTGSRVNKGIAKILEFHAEKVKP